MHALYRRGFIAVSVLVGAIAMAFALAWKPGRWAQATIKSESLMRAGDIRVTVNIAAAIGLVVALVFVLRFAIDVLDEPDPSLGRPLRYALAVAATALGGLFLATLPGRSSILLYERTPPQDSEGGVRYWVVVLYSLRSSIA